MSNVSSPLFSNPHSPIVISYLKNSHIDKEKREDLRTFESKALSRGYYYSKSILDTFGLVQIKPRHSSDSSQESDSSDFYEGSPGSISSVSSNETEKVCNAQISVENIYHSSFRIVFFDVSGDRNQSYLIHPDFSVMGLRGFANERVVFVARRGKKRIGFRLEEIDGCFLKVRIDLEYYLSVKTFKNQSFSLDPITQKNHYL